MVLLAVLALSGYVRADQQQEKGRGTEVSAKRERAIPKLEKIIPLATKLSGGFAELNNQLAQTPDLSGIERVFRNVGADFERDVRIFDELVGLDGFSTVKVYTLIRNSLEKKDQIEEASEPLIEAIGRVDRLKKKWQVEKNLWVQWQSTLLNDQTPEQIELTFSEALKILDTGEDLLLQRLNTMLALQAHGAGITGKIDTLRVSLRGLIANARETYLHQKSSPMFSEEYLSRFNGELWKAAVDGLLVMSLPSAQIYAQNRWNFVLQFLSFLVVYLTINRNREALKESQRWRFLPTRPVSSALFIAIMVSLPFSENLPAVDPLKLVYTMAGGLTCMRIMGQVHDSEWKRRAVGGIIVLYLITEILITIALPHPLARLYIFFASLVAAQFLLRWARYKSKQNEKDLLLWSIRVFVCFFAVITVAVFFEHEGLAAYLFKSTVISMALTLPCILFIHMMYGCLNWLFFKSPVWEIKLLRNDCHSLVDSFGFLFAAVTIGFGLIPAFLMAWDLYDSVPSAIHGMYSLGVEFGSWRITLTMLVMSAGSLYLAYLISRFLPKLLLDEKITGKKMARGVQRSIGQLIRYCIMFVGFVIAVTLLGFQFSNLTLILSAFGVGIGFGLQGIVNNFVSGLILLFERPLTEGDTIEVGTSRVHIKKIGLRSTVVQTFDHADLIIPNADLINNQVINWTLTNREVRLIVPVGVAYGSDIALVVEIMLACSKNQKEIVKSPAPEVLFMEFGESSLNFELRVWVQDVDRRLQVKSNLYHEIEQRFRDENVEIPFPQRDLHLRSPGAAAGLLPGNSIA